MPGNSNSQHDPVAYSYNTTSDGESTGHTVTIAPGQLDGAIKKFTDKTASSTALSGKLTEAMLTQGDFGTIPSSGAVATELQAFIADHVRVMQTMGGVLDDFVARVKAAAQLGYETDPETRRQLAWAHRHMA